MKILLSSTTKLVINLVSQLRVSESEYVSLLVKQAGVHLRTNHKRKLKKEEGRREIKKITSASAKVPQNTSTFTDYMVPVIKFICYRSCL